MKKATTKKITIKTFSTAKGADGPVSGIAVQVDERQPRSKTIKDQNQEIKQEKSQGDALLKAQNVRGWEKPQTSSFVSGSDTGTLAWLVPLFKKHFGVQEVAYRKRLRMWNFPPDGDNPKKKHEVMLQFFYQIDERFVCLDVFDDKTPQKKIDIIKAWLERIGYRYTYITGSDIPKQSDQKKFSDLVFVQRLKLMNPKDKNYPEFKVPQTYREAGLSFGG